jgi:hypothetical protein
MRTVQIRDEWIEDGRVPSWIRGECTADEKRDLMERFKQRLAERSTAEAQPRQALAVPEQASAARKGASAAEAASIAAETLATYASRAADPEFRRKHPTLAAYLDKNHAWPAATVAASPDPTRDGRPVELRAADEWQVSPEIRAEFMDDRERYVEFRRAEEAGLSLKPRRKMTVSLTAEEEAAARRGELSVG